MYKPKNKAPKFTEPITEDEVQFDVGKAWEFLLPEVFDFDGDEFVIEVTS